MERVARERRTVPLDDFLLNGASASATQPMSPPGFLSPAVSAERLLSVRQRGCLRPLPLSGRLLTSHERPFVFLGRSQFVANWTAVVKAAGGRVVQGRGKRKQPCVTIKRGGRSLWDGRRGCAVHLWSSDVKAAWEEGGGGQQWLVVRDGEVALPRCWESVRIRRGSEAVQEVPVSWLADCLIASELLPLPTQCCAAPSPAAQAGPARSPLQQRMQVNAEGNKPRQRLR